MMDGPDEDDKLRSAAMQNIGVIRLARQRAESELIAANEALIESNQRLQLALDAAQMDTWTWEAVTGQMTLGPRAARMFGFPADTLVTREQVRARLHPEDAERARRGFDDALVNRTDYANEYRVVRSDGEHRWIAMTGRGRYARDGTVQGMTGMFQEISERKRSEAQLKAAMAAADQANRAKSDFLSGMSHELRTPLNAILGFTQLIESGSPPPTPVQQRSLEQILKGGWYLLDLINDILDLALIESGKLSLSIEPVSLAMVLRDCQAMVEPQALGREIVLCFPQGTIPYHVSADLTRIKQALINLLSNAIKYNRTGGTVTVTCAPGAPGQIRISVADTGAGLAPRQIEQLFQPFNRLGRETGAEQGTGIGLVVTRRLVELMGGTIGVTSTVGEGCEFFIEMPIAAEHSPRVADAAPLTPALPASNLPSRSLLYVEDNPANLEFVKQLLERRPDLRLLSAATGNLGIMLARACLPDLILMDINLPGINGIETMRILHADPATQAIPVIALSANALPADIETGLAAGFADYLTKPIKVDRFIAVLDAALLRLPAPADRALHEA